MKSSMILIVAIFFTFCNTYASDVYWADTLLGVSSEANGRFIVTKLYKAVQALGKPSVMPDFGESPAAWMPEPNRKSVEWIKVGFKSTRLVRQIAIAENVNPGAISKVILSDESGKESLVFNNLSPSPVSFDGKMFNIFVNPPIQNVNSVKIEVSTLNYIDVYQIDAVGVSSSKDTIKHRINLPPDDLVIDRKENLGENINSIHYEFGPVISADGKKLFFTREKHPDNIGKELNQDVWLSELQSDSTFSQAQNIGAPVNNERNNFVIGTSQDGNTIYIGNVYHQDGTLTKGISKSFRTDDGWSFPDSITIENYYNKSPHGSYSFGANGKVLILSLEREDSFGQSDLYYSLLKDDGTWGSPINLGAAVNTVANEESPFLASDGVSLYFSTSGFPGYGANDMFVTRRMDSTWQNWSEPLNLGSSINTKGWDGYYTITASGEWAYFVSNEEVKNKEDIYRIKLPQAVKPLEVVLVKGRVLNAKTRKPLEADIIYETLDDGKNAGVARSNAKTGEYAITLPGGKQYGFLAQAKGFASINENIDLIELRQFKELNRDLMLVPIESGQKVRLNNIFFDFAEYELLPASFIELRRVIQLLNENENMKITIEGHTDNIGTYSANQLLSENRAKSVYNYFIENGIDKKRLKYKGFGTRKPIADNNTEEGRQMNRRVEFSIE